MKPVSEFFSTITPVGQGFPSQSCPEVSDRAGIAHFFDGTPELATFRDILMDMGPGINEEDLVIQMRAAAQRYLPCDSASIAIFANDFFQVFEKPQGRESVAIRAGRRTAIWNTLEPRLISEEVADQFRHASGVQAPFRINGAFAGTVSFLAKTSKAFRKSDLLVGQRIADSIGLILAKARTVGPGQRREPVRGDWKGNVVRAICEVPDIHRILPQISEFLRPAIPHDRLTISFHDKDRNISLKSASNGDGPGFERFQLSSNDFPRDGSSVIINDLLTHQPVMRPFDFHSKATDAGYRSFLVTHVWSGQHGLGFVFWSKRASAFQRCHVPSAQEVADLCAVADSREALVPRIGSFEEQNLEEQNRDLRSAVKATAPSYTRPENSEVESSNRNSNRDFRKRAESWNAVVRSATQVASTDTTVLLMGETGTGKEVVARLIYSESARKTGPFVAVNCAALPDSLLESELFGFERGAFTGAYHNKRGQIELAQKGVLFLDELSEMSLSAQAKLLRVLETREFQPLGGSRPRRVDIRLIGATNRNLKEEIRAGRFRADLYYRLSVFEITLPPLRSRPIDILPLAYQFVSEMNNGSVSKPAGISPRAQEALLHYQWPGNVRELRNVIERAAILCEGELIEFEHLAFKTATTEYSEINEVSVVERRMIERVLRECNGNKAQAARILGLSRTQLYVRLRRYADKDSFAGRRTAHW